MLLAQANTKHINTVAHEGKVLIVASVVADGTTKLFYTIKQDGFEDSALQNPNGPGWDQFKALVLPNDSVGDASVKAKEKEELTYQNGSKYLLYSIYTSAHLTADAPVQLVSHNGHVYVFRQSTRGTLLVDRFVLDGMTNTLVPKLEVRFKRSRQRYQPIKAMKISSGGQLESVDSLDFRDMQNQPFYEPTTELCPEIINNLEHGWFSAVVTPTNEQDSYRWHIFAYNRTSKKVDLLTLRAGSEQIFDVQDHWFRTVDPVTDQAHYDSIPGLIRRELELQDGAGKPLAISNGLAAVKYDVQREQQTQNGPQLIRDTSKILLAVPTDQGIAALSFAIAADGRLAQIASDAQDTTLRSQEREILLPLNLLDTIRPVGDSSPAPAGTIAGMSRATEDGSADRLRVQVGDQDQTALKRLKNGDVIKLSNTISYNGLYRVGAVHNGSFVIDAPFKFGEVGDWEKVEDEDTGLIFDGMVTSYEKSGDGKLTVQAINHGLAAGDLVQIVGSDSYDGEYPIIKHNEHSFTVQRLWLNGAAVNIQLESRKRRGLVFDGERDWIEVPLSAELKVSVGFALEAWVKLNSASDQTLIATGPAPLNLAGAAQGGWQAVLSVSNGKFTFALYPFGPDAQTIRLESANGAALNEWTHVACLFDGTALQLLENGEVTQRLPVEDLHQHAVTAHQELVAALRAEQDRQEAAQSQSPWPTHPVNYDAGKLLLRNGGHTLSAEAGDTLVLAVSGEQLAQRWRVEADGDVFVIRNLATNHVLDENGYQSTWHQSDSQRWQLDATSDGYYILRSKSRGTVLEAHKGQVRLGAVQPQDTQDAWSQQWSFAPLGENKVNRARTALAAAESRPPQSNAPIVINTKTLTLARRAKATSALGRLSTLDEPLHGQLADARVWVIARTLAEIRNAMYLQLTGRETGLAGYWRLGGVAADEDGVWRVFDFSAHGNHGTAHGAPYAGGITLGRTLRDGSTEAIGFSNGDLYAVREGATYVESFEFRTDSMIDPSNADGMEGQIFKPSLWGCLSRSSAAKQSIAPMQENFQFEGLDEGWQRASCRFIVPQGVRLLRCFELADVRGAWGTLEIRRHMVKLVSDTVTESSVSESARLTALSTSNSDQLPSDPTAMLRVQRLTEEEQTLKQAYEDEVANPLNYWCRIVAEHSEMCIYIHSALDEDGAQAEQWEWHTTNEQGEHGMWRFEPLADGYYRIVGKDSEKGLYIEGASQDDGARLRQWADDRSDPNGDHGKWKLEPVGEDNFNIVAKHSGKSLDVLGGQKTNGTPIIQWRYEGGDHQHWTIERVGDATNTKIEQARMAWENKKSEREVAQRELDQPYHLQSRQQELLVQKPPLEARLKELNSSLFARSNLEQLRLDRDTQQALVDRLTREAQALRKTYDDEVANPFNYWCRVKAKHSGQYLFIIIGNSLKDGEHVLQVEWSSLFDTKLSDYGRWKFEPLGEGYYRIVAKASGKCLFVDGASQNDGAQISQWPGIAPQPNHGRWKFEPLGDGYFKIVVKHSGKCLDVPGARTDNLINIQQWSWGGGAHQQWKLEPAGDAINKKIEDAQKAWKDKDAELLRAQSKLNELNKQLSGGEVNRAELDAVRAKLAALETELADVTRELAPLLHPAEVLRQLDAAERDEASLVTRQKELLRLLTDSQNRAAAETLQRAQQSKIDLLRKEESHCKQRFEAEAQNPLNYWCRMAARHSGQYLGIFGTGDAMYALQQMEWLHVLDTPYGRWKFELVEDGYYKIVAKHNGKCLTVFPPTSDDNMLIIQSTWEHLSSNQGRWKFELVEDGYYKIVAKHSGKCLEVFGALKLESVALVQTTWQNRASQQFKLEIVGDHTNDKIQAAQTAWTNKQSELKAAEHELDRLNSLVNANNNQILLWADEIIHIKERLKKLLEQISALRTAYLDRIAKANSTAQTMPDLLDQNDLRGLKVQGALLPFAQPATRLHALESCAGRVTLSYQDRNGSLRQTHYDTAYDADGKGEEWLPDKYRAALAFDGSRARVMLPANLFDTLHNQVTIEFWAKGGDQLPKAATFFSANDSAHHPRLHIQLPNENGEVVWEAGLKTDSATIDRLAKLADARHYRERWTHWAFVKDCDTGEMRIYVNGALWHKNEPQAKDGSDLLRQSLGAIGIGTLGGLPGQNPDWQGQIAELRIWNVALGERELETNSVLTLNGSEPGLVAYYPFNEATGDIARDQTGRGQTLQVTNCTWVPCTAPIGRMPGASLQLLNQLKTFDGQATMVELPTLDLDFGDGFTLDVRVKFDDLSRSSTLVNLGNGADGANIVLANEGGDNPTLVFKIIDSTSSVDVSCANAIRAGQWLDIAATIDPDGMARLYLDGVEKANHTLSLPINGLRTRNYIGKNGWSDDGLFKGAIASAQLWNYAHSADQVKQSRRSGVVSNSLISAEYSRVRLDNQKRKTAMMLRCLAMPGAEGVRLLDEQRIEELEIKWIGNAQINPTLVGYIEGAPPLPTENLTEEADYNGATSVELIQSSDVEYSWTREQDVSLGGKGAFFLGQDMKVTAGVGVETELLSTRAGFNAELNLAYHWRNNSTVAAGHTLKLSDRLALRGSQEQEAHFPHLGKRFIPKNVGYALVISGLADVFVSKLKRSGRMVGYQVLPVEGVPLDVNTITFMINPAYIMAGSLDGLTGTHATSNRFFRHVPEMRSQYGSLYPASYFRLKEAYDLKQQIDRQDELHQSYFNQFNAGLVDETALDRQISDTGSDGGLLMLKGLDEISGASSDADKQLDEQIKAQETYVKDLKDRSAADAEIKAAEKQLAALREQYQKRQEAAQEKRKQEGEQRQEQIAQAHTDLTTRAHASESFAGWQRKMENLQIRAGKRNIVNTYVWDGDGGFHAEVQEFASTVEHSIGGSLDFGFGVGGQGAFRVAGAAVEFNVMAAVNMTQTMSKTEKGSKAMELSVDLNGVESRGITDYRDYPIIPGEKVDRYRFMSFYLENNVTHWHDFFTQVVDPEWLASNDEEARALRQALAAAPNKVWRVLHRVTYVERPALMGFGRSLTSRAKEADDIQELRRQVHDLSVRVAALQQEMSSKLNQLLIRQSESAQ